MAVGFVVVAILAACAGGAAGLFLGNWEAVVSALCSGMLAPFILVAFKIVCYARRSKSEPDFLAKEAHS